MNESEKLLFDLRQLAIKDSKGKKFSAIYSIYVIEIEKVNPAIDYDFYVGYTGNPIRYRFSQHIPNHKFAARIFRKSYAKALHIRWDLISEYPKFHTKRSAELAEGLVANAIHHAGWKVYSDRLKRE